MFNHIDTLQRTANEAHIQKETHTHTRMHARMHKDAHAHARTHTRTLSSTKRQCCVYTNCVAQYGLAQVAYIEKGWFVIPFQVTSVGRRCLLSRRSGCVDRVLFSGVLFLTGFGLSPCCFIALLFEPFFSPCRSDCAVLSCVVLSECQTLRLLCVSL